MKKVYLYSFLITVALGTGGYFWLSSSSGKDIKYRTEKITRGNLVVNVRATGTINPVQTVQVGSQVSGILLKIFVDFNSEVKKDQIIAIIDSTFLYASVKEARANLERNQAQVNEAQRSLRRATELFKKDLVSQADLDAAQTGYESATAQKKQSEAALDRAEVNLRYAIIRAPIDGVVISRDVDVGQTVAASLQAPKLFVIANDLQRMQVEASVDEADIGQVKLGQTVTFTVDAYPEEQFRGNVTQVRLSPVTVQNVVTYTVIIEVPNPDLKLRPGMTATVSILVDKRDDVLRVPVLAIRFQPPSEVLQRMNDAKPVDAGTPESKPDTSDRQARRRQQGERRGGQREDGDQAQRGSGQEDGRRRWQGREGGDQMQRQAGWHNETERKMSHVWMLDAAKNLRTISISTGLSDNRFVEVLGGDLKEGDDVIVGTTGGETAMATGQQSNPFQQRMPGGGGGGRRGF
ncbi:MAG TPA: efflux RND transporter periplasmic adaptor subunit [Bacteroidota bacterium]|nr:efflux RND transporter periplasmic adaptor subunit [Bacteroidota bacterium]